MSNRSPARKRRRGVARRSDRRWATPRRSSAGSRTGSSRPCGDVPLTKLKSGADLVLYVDDQGRKQPLLATWLYGLGRAAAFPFDPTQPEAGNWAAWQGYAKLWSQLVRWAIREEVPWETRQTVRFRDGSPFLEVQTFDDIGEGNLQAQIFTNPERSVTLSLTPVAPRVYRAPLPPLAAGKYALLLTRRAGDRTLGQRRDVLTVDASADEPGECGAGAQASRPRATARDRRRHRWLAQSVRR